MKKSLYIKILFNDARTYLGMWDGRVAVTKDMNPRKNKKVIKRSTCSLIIIVLTVSLVSLLLY